MELDLIRHYGVVLDAGESDAFDSKGAAFACAIVDDSDETYLFYSGASDTQFLESSIGLALSEDGISFRKMGEVLADRSGTFCADSALTPAIFRSDDRNLMILAGSTTSRPTRRIGIAATDRLTSLWRIQRELLSPREVWEGYDIDCGAGMCKKEGLLYYSSIGEERVLPAWRGLMALDRLLKAVGRRLGRKRSHRVAVRRIGIARVVETTPGLVAAQRYENNPLGHLNGPIGSWNESLFCPSYLNINGKHLLFTAASTYSIGPPFKQYIGWIESESEHFERVTKFAKLIDGPEEKQIILPTVKSEIALDSPSPIIRHDELWLYYSVMDRADGIWKTALSTYRIDL